mgnify:FL=1
MRNIFIIIGILAVVAIAGYESYIATTPDDNQKSEASNIPAITVSSQKPGNTVIVSSLTIKEKGFLVVRKDESGVPGKILGVSNILPMGENKNITVNLEEDTRDGQVIFIMAYVAGNSDGVMRFPGPDIPANDMGGKIILARVNIAGTLDKGLPENTVKVAPKNTITYTLKGFEPDTMEIKAGESVTFINTTDLNMWIASDPHPAHTGLPGFDERGAVGNSGKYAYIFTQSGSWKYHNHMDPDKRGVIIVK